MALPININDLITGQTVEWERIEFKEGWNPEDIIHTICAFANDINNWGGGYIIIGIRESDGRPILPPVGLEVNQIDSIQKKLLNLCNRLRPNYSPVAEPLTFQKKTIFIIWVPGGQNRPYQAPSTLGKKGQYLYYIRKFSNTVKANIEEQKELLSLAASIPFDDRIHHHAEISDFKLPLIQSFLREVNSDLYKTSSEISFEKLCRQMKIVDGTAEYLKPRNIGLLFFNDMPQKFIPLSQIEVVQFPTTPGEDRLTEKIFQGPIHRQIKDVLIYLKNVILKEYVHKLPDRAEAVRFFNYPYQALEESIVNAMYHRSYEISEPVEIRIHPDKIHIVSYPGADRSIKQSDIEQGILIARRYRNRRIGEFFKELKLTEGRCTGIPKIITAMKNNGSPPPIFKTDEDRTYFITTLLIHEEALSEVQPEHQAHDKNTKHITPKNLSKLVLSLSQVCPKSMPVEIAVNILWSARNEINLRTLMEITKKTNRSRFRKNFVTPLIKSGLLEQTIPDKPKSSNQKYVATAKAKNWLNLTK